MKLIRNLIRLVATALVLLLILLGVAAAAVVDGSLAEKVSALVACAVAAALIAQILLFHRMEGQLALMAEMMERLAKAAADPAGLPPPPPCVPAAEPPGNPVVRPAKSIPGSSSNPPPSAHKAPAHQPAPHQPSAKPAAQWPSGPPAASKEEGFDENPAASLQETARIREELERRDALEAAAVGGWPAPAREVVAGAGEAKSAVLDATEIVQVWNRYLADGNGYFDAKGLQGFLAAAGIHAAVLPAETLVGLGVPVLGVTEPGSRERVFLLPDFTRPPKALAAYFDLDSEIKNSTRMNRLVRAAELRRNGGQYEVRQRGALE